MTDRKKGHWVIDIINGKALYSCSCCLRDITYAWGYHYCPACGAELEGEEINET